MRTRLVLGTWFWPERPDWLGGDERAEDREATIRELGQRLERLQREERQIEQALGRLSN